MELALRIVVQQPVPGQTYCLRRGLKERVAAVRAADQDLAFELTVRVGDNRPDGGPNLLGPFTQGPPAVRFVYINSGTAAGDPFSCYTRAAKVPLTGITWELVRAVADAPGSVLEARIHGRARDGGPACASIPLLDGGWKLVPADQ
jgi:hypothetical protein